MVNNKFFYKGATVGLMNSCAAIQLCHCNMKAPPGNMQTNGHSCAPIILPIKLKHLDNVTKGHRLPSPSLKQAHQLIKSNDSL